MGDWENGDAVGSMGMAALPATSAGRDFAVTAAPDLTVFLNGVLSLFVGKARG